MALDNFKVFPVLSPGKIYQSIIGALEASGFDSLTDCWASVGEMAADPASCKRKAGLPVSCLRSEAGNRQNQESNREGLAPRAVVWAVQTETSFRFLKASSPNKNLWEAKGTDVPW